MHAVTIRRVALLLASALWIPAAFAGNCSWIAAPTALTFGNYSVFSTGNTKTSTSFTLRCTPNTTGTLTLSRGGSGSFSPRRMSGPGGTPAYNIYLDPNGQYVWGDASGATYDVYNGTAGNKDFTDLMYGIAPPGSDLSPGTYSDTVMATLSYTTPGGGGGGTLPAQAISVTMTVLPECRVDTLGWNFGNYNPLLTAALTSNAFLKVYCTKTTGILNLSLGLGANPSGSQRRMKGGSEYLDYNLTMGSISGTSTTSTVPINNGFQIGGSIRPLQDVTVSPTPGSYTDTVTATIDY